MRGKLDPIVVIVCEHDIDDPLRSSGAIMFEQYTRLDQEQVIELARSLAHGGKYGRVWTAKLDDLVEVKTGQAVPRRS